MAGITKERRMALTRATRSHDLAYRKAMDERHRRKKILRRRAELIRREGESIEGAVTRLVYEEEQAGIRIGDDFLPPTPSEDPGAGPAP